MNTTAQRRKPARNADASSPAVASSPPEPSIPIATVRRRKCGTSPFDENWLNLDCCGLFCAFLTYGLHAYAVVTVCNVLIPPWMSYVGEDGVRTLSWTGHAHRFVFTFIAVMAVFSHYKTMTTDPGTVPPDARPLPETEVHQETKGEEDPESPNIIISPKQKGKRLCRRCMTFKPKRAHHCSVCGRCVIKMDHHCPWVNNCVGIGNHKYFLLFIFYTFLSCLYSISLAVIRLATCTHARHGHRHHGPTCLDQPTHLLNIFGLVIEGLLFGMFTSCMMVDQFDVISSNMTHIDRLKGADDSPSPLTGVAEVFGSGGRRIISSRFRTDWLSPFAKVCFPQSVRDEVYGFCLPNVCIATPTNDGNSGKEVEMAGNGRVARGATDIV